jgi:hypothetical protein
MHVCVAPPAAATRVCCQSRGPGCMPLDTPRLPPRTNWTRRVPHPVRAWRFTLWCLDHGALLSAPALLLLPRRCRSPSQRRESARLEQRPRDVCVAFICSVVQRRATLLVDRIPRPQCCRQWRFRRLVGRMRACWAPAREEALGRGFFAVWVVLSPLTGFCVPSCLARFLVPGLYEVIHYTTGWHKSCTRQTICRRRGPKLSLNDAICSAPSAVVTACVFSFVLLVLLAPPTAPRNCDVRNAHAVLFFHGCIRTGACDPCERWQAGPRQAPSAPQAPSARQRVTRSWGGRRGC